MKKAIYILLGLILILCLAVIIIGPMKIGIALVKPHHSFDDDIRSAPPSYSEEKNWAALPWTDDLSDMRPEGVEIDTQLKDIDVFFIHPTGYLRGAHWNAPMNPNSATEENTHWMMANQASAFSDCNVYAPRYRQATIFSFIEIETANAQSALDLAYEDILSAFDRFITHYNKGKPFILASHSQGTYHAIKLIKDKIDNSPLADNMIAAYIIGMSTVTKEEVAKLNKIKVCSNPTETNCLIHWATFAEGTPPQEGWGPTMICVNPLSWKNDEVKVAASFNRGYVKASGDYNLDFSGEDKAENVLFTPLGKPVVSHTFAVCKEGRLMVEKQETTSMTMGEGNYHGLDFQLFHMNIRENISQRAKAYFAKVDQDQTKIPTLPN